MDDLATVEPEGLQRLREALNPTATIFQLTAVYEIKDSLGGSRGTSSFSQQVATAPDPVLITSILAAANAAQGT